MKTCTICKESLPKTIFSKNSSRKDGLRDACKVCVVEQLRSYSGKLYGIFNNQQSNSRKRNHPAPNYSREAFCVWAVSNGYALLHANWVASGYLRKYAPSTDRLDDALPYSLSNLRLVTWKENDDKAHQDFISGKLISNHTAVKQFDAYGKHIATYPSQHAAQRITGISQGNIGMVCKQNTSRETAGGFKWEYENV